jgi:hypothetical protein
MGKPLLIVATMAVLFTNLFSTRPSWAEEKLDSKTIARLVTQLGSSNFGDREEATRALVQIGPIARGLLEKAAAGKDAEVRRRAEIVLERIEKDLDTAALLVPKRIRLNFQDTPITDAVAELAKKTGFAIQFEGDRTRLANRKITLDTGEIPFWDALDQFCRNAGLVERGPVLPKNNQAAANKSSKIRSYSKIKGGCSWRGGVLIPPFLTAPMPGASSWWRGNPIASPTGMREPFAFGPCLPVAQAPVKSRPRRRLTSPWKSPRNPKWPGKEFSTFGLTRRSIKQANPFLTFCRQVDLETSSLKK